MCSVSCFFICRSITLTAVGLCLQCCSRGMVGWLFRLIKENAKPCYLNLVGLSSGESSLTAVNRNTVLNLLHLIRINKALTDRFVAFCFMVD